MNAISGFLSDVCCATNYQNIQDATWVFPFGTSPYNSKGSIYKDALSSVLYHIHTTFTDSVNGSTSLRWEEDETNINDIITTGKLPEQNLIVNSNGESSFQIYVFPIPESEFFTLPFALFDEYSKFTEANVTSSWNYYWTDFDGKWQFSNGTAGDASDDDTDWKWVSACLSSTEITSISGMWDGIANLSNLDGELDKFELPRGVWKYQENTTALNGSTYTWSWQNPDSPDYFKPSGFLQKGELRL
jgi:hypothetical protein